MLINYHVTGSDRKRLVAAIAEHTGEKARYLGAPSFAYQVGGININVEGAVTIEDDSTAAALDAMFASPLTVTKKTKSGDRETDISPFILKTESTYDAENGILLLHAVLCADNANFLNPEYLLRAAESRLGLCFDDPAAAWYETIRTDLFLADGVTPFQ